MQFRRQSATAYAHSRAYSFIGWSNGWMVAAFIIMNHNFNYFIIYAPYLRKSHFCLAKLKSELIRVQQFIKLIMDGNLLLFWLLMKIFFFRNSS